MLIDGRREPLSLWCISIAESGERKSAADDIALEPHRIHERLEADKHRRDMVGHEADVAAYEEQRKQIMKNKVVSLKALRDVSDAIEDGLHKLGTAPSPPLLPWLIISTPTLEGLHKLYDRGRPSLGLFHDDGGEFVGGHSMSSDHRMKSAAGLSKLWDRGEFDRVRGADGAHKYYGRRLALHLMVQPVVAETLLGDPLLCGQGFLARTLLCWPGTRIGTRRYLETDLQADPALIEYRRVMTGLLDRASPVRPEAPQELEPRTLQLAPAAKAAWIALHDHFEDAMRDGWRAGRRPGLGFEGTGAGLADCRCLNARGGPGRQRDPCRDHRSGGGARAVCARRGGPIGGDDSRPGRDAARATAAGVVSRVGPHAVALRCGASAGT